MPQTLAAIGFQLHSFTFNFASNFRTLKNINTFVMFNGTKAIKPIYINTY